MKPKFRAWDEDSQKMNGNVEIYIAKDKTIEVRPKDDKTIVMQSTGLFDKNGKEIYEGDIVRFTLTDGFSYVTLEDGVVTYELGAFYVVNGLDEYIIGDINTNKIEVVGDIYENPELLKGKEKWKNLKSVT